MKRAIALLLAFWLGLWAAAGAAFAETPGEQAAGPAYAPGYYALSAAAALLAEPPQNADETAQDAAAPESLCALPKGALLRVTETDGRFGKLAWDGLAGWADLTAAVYKTALSDARGAPRLIADVSVFNAPEALNWEKLKAAGVAGAILRIGGRGYGPLKRLYADAAFTEHYKNAAAAGLPVGVYFFSFALTPAQAAEEADTVLETLRENGCELRLPVFIDIEGYSGDTQHLTTGKAACSRVVDTFCDTILRAGLWPGICTYTYFAQNLLEEQVFTPERAVWMADYRAEGCGWTGRTDLWQFTGAGRLPGSAGEIDLSFCYTDYPAMIAAQPENCANGLHRPGPDPEIVRDAVCTAEGERIRRCVNCGEIAVREAFPGTGHAWTLTETLPPDCFNPGTATYVCQNDPTHVKTETLPVTHAFGDWEQIAPPGYGQPGTQRRTCALCGESETRQTDPLPLPEFTPGDTDGDGAVRASDARFALRAAVRLETPERYTAAFLAADVNGDGRITAADARRILRAAVKLETL